MADHSGTPPRPLRSACPGRLVASQKEGAEHEKGIDTTGPSDDLVLIYLLELDGIGDGST
jgi:hypothetical protein